MSEATALPDVTQPLPCNVNVSAARITRRPTTEFLAWTCRQICLDGQQQSRRLTQFNISSDEKVAKTCELFDQKV